MSIRTIILAGATGAALVAGSMGAQAEGVYLGAGGASLLASQTTSPDQLEYNTRSAVGAYNAVGYRWDETLSTEVEGGLRLRDVEGAAQASNGRGADQSTKVLMLNARLSPPVRGPVKPYAGFGAGLAIVTTDDHSLRSENDQMAAAGQAMAGFSFEVSERTSLFAEYRYFTLLEDQAGPVASDNADRGESHIGFVGLKVKLGGFK